MSAPHHPVKQPSHYRLFADGTEALDVIKATLTPEEFAGYCKGNVLKYRLRAGKKDALEQDIAKAETYAKMLEDALPAQVESAYDVLMDERIKGTPVYGPSVTPKHCGPLSDCDKCPTPCR